MLCNKDESVVKTQLFDMRVHVVPHSYVAIVHCGVQILMAVSMLHVYSRDVQQFQDVAGFTRLYCV